MEWNEELEKKLKWRGEIWHAEKLGPLGEYWLVLPKEDLF